jgi:uncharacterized membrane protein
MSRTPEAAWPQEDEPEGRGAPRAATIALLVGAAAGLFFCGWSTADFVQHLDRQTHAIHCSFIPGLAAADASGSSGCHVALMSPYSSVLRSLVWGGIPATLAGMAVFAYLLYRGVALWVDGRERDLHATRYLLLASLLPVLTSLVYGGIAITVLETLCKLCLGIYGSSFLAFGGALFLTREAAADPEAEGGFGGVLVPGFGEGVVFVLTPVFLYVALAPDFSEYVGSCGELSAPKDTYGVMVALEPHPGARETIEVFDPLCPACAGFEERLATSGFGEQLDRKAVLFPLDSTCNWMIDQPVHPGACVISEAILCAGDQARAVIDWSFDNQELIRTQTAANPDAAAAMVKKQFPAVASCLGSASVKQKLNRSLRWAVANQLPILTPQLYIDGRKVCDEDTDLGLDWTLSRLLSAPRAN